ncbi:MULTISPECIES: hypothetical protein [unclassified Haladaptatus]|uniref:hypothetical protein n=1 Tax=unclassified Haladaptatus TaxID=2622732 RepID=UPI00209C2A3A|nr:MULTISPECIES: hypothetical protein [unclassified Haladaptatus]MCO8242628.1 hypothetical protein [Haladaptatus sp. AB643]MCO8252387.1 hypothetical protein [Haladaptatus sp. AB618]
MKTENATTIARENDRNRMRAGGRAVPAARPCSRFYRSLARVHEPRILKAGA